MLLNYHFPNIHENVTRTESKYLGLSSTNSVTVTSLRETNYFVLSACSTDFNKPYKQNIKDIVCRYLNLFKP